MLSIPIEVSARHLHIKQADLDILFGADYQLQKKSNLTQPGEFASEETVKLIGPKAELRARILGPIRTYTQVELSYTDCKNLGIETALRLSTNHAGTSGIKVIGPVGELFLNEGVIVSQRHIHLSPEDARANNFSDQQIVKVKINGPRAGILDNVVIRIKENHLPVLHIDTDEGNAMGINSSNNQGEIII